MRFTTCWPCDIVRPWGEQTTGLGETWRNDEKCIIPPQHVVREVSSEQKIQLLQTNNNPCVIPSAHLQESVLHADKVLDSDGPGGVVGVSNYQWDFAQAGGWYQSHGCSLENDLEITSVWSESQEKSWPDHPNSYRIASVSVSMVVGFHSPKWLFYDKMCSWQSCINTVQHAHPALRKLWDGGGRFKHSCHGSTKSSTQANETVCHCFDSRLQHLVQNGISTGIQKVIDDTRLLALVWWSCVYFTYQTNQNIWLKMRFNMQLLVACVAWQNPTINQSQWEPQPEKDNCMLCTAWETLVMLTLIHHRHQNYTALDPKQLKQTQRTSPRGAKIPIE